MHTRNPHLERARMLFAQDRRDLAEKELRQAIGQDPNESQAYALLALCLIDSENAANTAEGKECALRAVGLAPDEPFNHYVLARVMLTLNAPDRARAAINEALRLSPAEPQFWSLLAQLELNAKNHRAALEAAEHGLTFDAEHEGCINLRAIALTNLGQRAAATQAIASTLQRNPLNASSHANMGWTLLHEGKPRPAMDHFREALRIEPGMEWARRGIIEAMKARNPIYRLFLAYFLFMGRLSSRAQWGIIIGGYFGNQILRSVASSNPAVAPYIWPITAAYLIFALGTVIAVPLFNLLLFTSRFGRYALSTAERRAALIFGLFLLVPLTMLALWAVKGDELFAYFALLSGLVCIPVALAGLVRAGTPRWVMIAYAGGMLLLGVALTAAIMLNIPGASSFIVVYVVGCLGSTWVANIASSISPRSRA
jgi:Flp pilus assembly protein TadD